MLITAVMKPLTNTANNTPSIMTAERKPPSSVTDTLSHTAHWLKHDWNVELVDTC